MIEKDVEDKLPVREMSQEQKSIHERMQGSNKIPIIPKRITKTPHNQNPTMFIL